MVHFNILKQKENLKLCLFFFFLGLPFRSATVFNGGYLRFIEQTWTVNITCIIMSVVLSKCSFYTLRNMKQGKLSISFRGQLACFGVSNYYNL